MDSIRYAYQIIKERLESGAWHQGERLPPLAELAKMCAVSRSTMWRTLSILKKDSLVHTTAKGAIFAGKTGIARPTFSQGLLWERLKIRIGSDILTGTFTDSKLPSENKLALQYNVSVPTLKKAIQQLVREGLLSAHGRQHIISRSRFRYFSLRVVMISRCDENGRISIDDNRTQQLIENCERECAKSGYEYRAVGFNDRIPKGLISACNTIKSIPDIAGFIVNIWNPWDEVIRKRWFDLFGYLSAQGKPVIIIDQSGNLRLPDYISKNQNIRILRIAGVRAGEIVADFLIRCHHHHVAYVAPIINADWAQNRYTGLCRHFEQYDKSSGKVDLFSMSEIGDLFGLMLELYDLGEENILSLFRGHANEITTADLLKTLNQIKQHKHLVINKNNPAIMTIRSAALYLSGLADQKHDPVTFRILLDALGSKASSHAFRLYLRPFFEKILKNSSATAWVCSEFKTAHAALEFLSDHKKNIPDDISIIGFDNWKGDFDAGLTSFDFNMHGMVQQALLMIADPKRLKEKSPVTEVDGYLVERRTTKKLQKPILTDS